MVRLYDLIKGLDTHKDVLENATIRYYYAFALNRRGQKGDREKALDVITEVSLISIDVISL